MEIKSIIEKKSTTNLSRDLADQNLKIYSMVNSTKTARSKSLRILRTVVGIE